jgi:hypothetical protein
MPCDADKTDGGVFFRDGAGAIWRLRHPTMTILFTSRCERLIHDDQ